MKKFPKTLIIETASICNLKCVMCPQTAENFGRPKIFLQDDYINSLIPYVKEARDIQLHGIGEPLISQGFWELLKYVHPDAHCAVNSNFHKISESQMRILLESNLKHLCISLDSPNPFTYYKIRGAKLAEVVNNIKKIVEIQKTEYPDSVLKIGINMTLMEENYNQLLDMIDLGEEMNIKELATWPMNDWEDSETGIHDRNIRGWNFNYDAQLPIHFKEQYNERIDEAEKYSKEKNIKFEYIKL